MGKNYVALLTSGRDGHLPPVIEELQKRQVPFFRFSLPDFPQKATFSGRFIGGTWHGVLECEGQRCDLTALTSIWNRRRSGPHKLSSTVVAYARPFVQDEARRGMDGIWKCLDTSVFWLNHPDSNRAADNKLFQLRLAQQCGLSIPESLVTNDPAEVLRFFEQCERQMVYKTLGRNILASPEGNRYIFTSQVLAEHLKQLEGIRTTAHLFQRLIPKKLEIRATIIGGTIFAAELYSQQTRDGKIDYRTSYDDLSYGQHHLPAELRHQLLHLMWLLHLEYAAMDLIVTPDDRYVFLEANCSGQFGWIEDEIHFPMSRTLVDLLIGEAPRVSDVLGV